MYASGDVLTELPPLTTMADLKTAVNGFCALLDHAHSVGAGVIPHRVSQDVVESWFGHQRQACGSNRNMTGRSKIKALKHCVGYNMTMMYDASK